MAETAAMFSIDARDSRDVAFDRAIVTAERVRGLRGDLLQRYAAGGTVADLRAEVDAADAASPIRTMRLLGVIEAMPSSGGKVASRRLLASLGLAEDEPLGALSGEQWARLGEPRPVSSAP